MIDRTDIAFIEGLIVMCGHNRKLVNELKQLAALGRAWLGAPPEVRKATAGELEDALAVLAAWESSRLLKGKPLSALEEASAVLERWQSSPVLKKSSLQDMRRALEQMREWKRRPQCNKVAPRDLVDAHDAFNGASPGELAKGDAIAMAWKQSPKLKGKSRQQFNTIFGAYCYWHDNKRLFNNASPRELVAAERLALEWKKQFGNQSPEELADAESLVSEWKKHPVLKKESLRDLRRAMELAAAWNSDIRLKKAMVKGLEKALIKIKELAHAPEAMLFFDGKTLYWKQKGRDTAWPAWSGKREFWENNRYTPKDQENDQGGPMPEGFFDVRQKEFQVRDDGLLEMAKQGVAKVLNKDKGGRWPGNYHSWGDSRVWVHRRPGQPPTIRNKMAIHGGADPGSEGCIDLVDNLPDFADRFRLYGRDMVLEVWYPPQYSR